MPREWLDFRKFLLDWQPEEDLSGMWELLESKTFQTETETAAYWFATGFTNRYNSGFDGAGTAPGKPRLPRNVNPL